MICLVGLWLLAMARGPATDAGAIVNSDFGTVAPVGRLLFTKYLVPFEVTSVLLLVAIVGSVVMGKRKI